MEQANKFTEDVDKMMTGLKKTFDTHKTKKISYRKQQLKSLLKGLKVMESEILLALKMDLRRSDYLSRLLETQFNINEVSNILSNFKTWAKGEDVATPMFMSPGTSKVEYEPLGTVLVMGSWNYPFMGCIQPLATAIAAGNTAVVKPSEIAKSSSKVIKKLVEKYLDPTCYSVMEGGVEVAKALTAHADFDLIVFTGSSEKGKLVAEAAAKNLTPCILELGGKCPAIVDSKPNQSFVGSVFSSSLDYAAARIVWGKFINSGQTCLACDYVLVREESAAEFKKCLVKHLKASFGDRSDKYVDQDKGSLISQDHAQRIKGMLEGHGGTLVYGPQSEEDFKDFKNNWVPPTIIENPSADSDLMQEEIFGPILPIKTYKTIDEAINHIRYSTKKKPLAVYYFGCSFGSNGKRVRQETSSGAFALNDAVTQVCNLNLPFGGVGESGYGSYHGIYGFRSMSNSKACYYKLPLNFWPFNVLNMPFTSTRKTTAGLFMKFGGVGQKQLVKRIIWLLILIWLVKGFATGRFQKKWRMYKPMVNMVWGMVKPKFLR